MLRFLRALFRGIRPLAKSLDSIASDLRTMRRIQEYRLMMEGHVLPDEQLMRKPRDQDMTEISWDVKEPEINPETGKPIIEDGDWRVDMSSIFGRH